MTNKRPIQKLSYRIHNKATMGRGLQLYIDNEPLLRILENAMPANEQPWAPKKEAKVVVENLKTSIYKAGKYELLTCSHCNDARDLLLDSFTVSFEEGIVLWKIHPPSLNPLEGNIEQQLVFTFHRSQYQKMIAKILKEKR